jgi:ribosomal protein L11 methyltransferase
LSERIKRFQASSGWILKVNGQTLENRMSAPYGELFIYYLQGRVRDWDERCLGERFLGNWVEDNTSFLFFSAPSREIVLRLLRKRSDLEWIDDYRFAYEEWQGGGLKPVKIENFLIVPPWEEIEAKEEETTIILDPGVVFGTGLHPTTKDCLRAMAHLRRKYSFQKVVDLGTGTGILALAAAFLGAEQVLALDLNPLCVKTAKRNVSLNHHQAADLVVANIHHAVVQRILGTKNSHEMRWFVISGLMRSQARDLKWQMEKYGLRIVKEWDHEMTWYTMLAKNW